MSRRRADGRDRHERAIVRAGKLALIPHADNRHAFVAVRNDNSMLMLDLTTGETLARVEGQNSPDDVTYSPVQRRP